MSNQKSNERTALWSFQWNASEKGHYSVHGDVSEVAVSKLVGQPGSSGRLMASVSVCVQLFPPFSSFFLLANFFFSRCLKPNMTLKVMLRCFNAFLSAKKIVVCRTRMEVSHSHRRLV